MPSKHFLSRLILFSVLFLTGCSGLVVAQPATPMPDGYLPTAIALTLQANGVGLFTPSPAAQEMSEDQTPAANSAGEKPELVVLEPTALPDSTATPTPVPVTLAPPAPPTPTPYPEIPDAAIQIFRLGELSKVTSPIQVSGYLRRGYVAPLQIELRGEDGRLLVRQVKNFEFKPDVWVNFAATIDFEISAAAEVGRLVISVLDPQGRMMAVNSVNLILLSVGETDVNPATALEEAIVIEEPGRKALIQGGTLFVSGFARPFTNEPLRILLVDEEGRVVGQRLAGVELPEGGGYGPFAVEIPYTVSELTQVRLIVYEDGTPLSEYAHLASREILLSP